MNNTTISYGNLLTLKAFKFSLFSFINVFIQPPRRLQEAGRKNGDLEGELARLRGDLEGELARLRGEIQGLRSCRDTGKDMSPPDASPPDASPPDASPPNSLSSEQQLLLLPPIHNLWWA